MLATARRLALVTSALACDNRGRGGTGVTTPAEPGQFFDPLNAEHIAEPDELMHASRLGCRVGQVSDILYCVNSDVGVRQVFDDTENFSNKGNFSVGAEDVQWPFTVATQADPPAHTALRARLLKDFAPVRLRKLTPQVESIVTDCLNALPKSGRVDLYADYAHFIPAKVLYALIGIPQDAWSEVQRWSDVIVATVPAPTHQLPEFVSLTTYLAELTEERRTRPDDHREDVLDNLCFSGPGEADMSTPEVMTHILQLVVASTDTTRALIANCLYRLLENRNNFEAVQADRSQLPNAIEESLRMDSPAQFMVRSVMRDVTIDSYAVPAGKKVYLNIQSANHDENRWGHDSRRYRLDRPNPAAHLAFGRGIHTCIGAPLARIEAQVAISALLDRYPHMTLDPDAKWVKCPGALTRRVRSVPVRLTEERTR
jgi:cytochrome P450